jgi:hypothetical protein
MRGAIPPFSHKSSWRGAWLSTGTNLPSPGSAQDKKKWLLLVKTVWTFGFHKRRGISWLAEWLWTSQERLCPTELVGWLVSEAVEKWRRLSFLRNHHMKTAVCKFYRTASRIRAVIAQLVWRWAMGWAIGVLGFDSRRGLGIFLFTTASRTALRLTQPPIQWAPGALSLEVKRPGCGADYSPPSTAEVIEWVELYLHSSNTPSWLGAYLSTGTTLPLPSRIHKRTTGFMDCP